MRLFGDLFGNADNARTDDSAPETADAVATTAGKIKLNFKKLPKKVVQAMADQTTGQEIDRSSEDEDKRGRSGQRGGLSGAFNRAASPDRDGGFLASRERMMAQMKAREQRARDLAAAAEPRPRMPYYPSPSP